MSENWLDQIRFNAEGLIPAIAQDAASGRVLMMAWMNREALRLTAEKSEAVYWSRSRGKLWHKGEQSGHVQQVQEIRFDCDEDVILLKVEQKVELHVILDDRAVFIVACRVISGLKSIKSLRILRISTGKPLQRANTGLP